MTPLIRVVPGLPGDTLLVASPRLDENCRRRECDHVHEVVARFDAARGDEVAAHQSDNDTAHRPSADGAAPPSPPRTSASSDRIGTAKGSAAAGVDLSERDED